MSALTLDEKVAHSRTVIREAIGRFSKEELCVAWTGGKDSTSMLWLFRETCGELGFGMPRAMFMNESSVFNEILELVEGLRKQWGVDVMFVKNRDVSDKAQTVGDIIPVANLSNRNQQELARLGFTEETFPR